MSELRIHIQRYRSNRLERWRWIHLAIWGEPEDIICDEEVRREFPAEHESALTNEVQELWLEVTDEEPKDGDWREFRGEQELYSPLEQRLINTFLLEADWLDEDFEGNENGELFILWWRVTNV